MHELLISPRLQVRQIVRADAPALLKAVLASKAELAAWETWAIGEYTLEMATDFTLDCQRSWQSGSSFTCALIEPSSQQFLGTTALRIASKDNNFANLGYWVHSHFTRRGMASAAAKAMAAYGFETLGYTRIEIVAQESNFASCAVAEKLGAKLEGILRNRLMYAGQPRDAAMYSLLPDVGGA